MTVSESSIFLKASLRQQTILLHFS